MKKIFALNNANITDLVTEIEELFQKEGIESNRQICSKLLFEEILYIYQTSLGEGTEAKFESYSKKGKLHLIITVPGKELDPNEDDLSIYKVLLKQAPDIPTWAYTNGKNIITLEMPLFNTLAKDLDFAWKYTKIKKRTFLLGAASQLFATVFNIFAAFLLAKLIISYTDELFMQAILTGVGIFVLNVLEQGIMYVASMSYNAVSYAILASIQEDMTDSVLKIRTNTMTNYGSGLFIQRMTTDTATFAAGLNTVMDLLIQIGSFVGTLIAILIVSPSVFLFELFVLVCLYFMQHYCAKKLIDTDRIARTANEKYSGFITEIVRGFNDIRTLHCEEPIREELKERVVDSSNKMYALGAKRFGYRFLSSLISNIGTLIFMLILAVFISKGFLASAMAVVLLNYHTRLGPNVILTIDRFTDFYTKFRLSCERINSIIYGQQFPKETFGNTSKDSIDGSIEFENVKFSYRRRANEYFESNKVLKGINFKINAKQTAAFVGASGCGKSTIFKLLDKLYLPNHGKIMIDGIDINDMDKDTLRNSMSIINQSPYIFHASIRDNLRFVKPELTEEEMIDVCKAACIHDDIMHMEEGYDTILGEGGIDISGGQKQRLAIARGLLCNASIFVLDEATSALDNNTQSKVLEAIKNIGENHTVLLIAHRLSTVVDADVIFYIGEGKVIGSGKHDELLANCEEYRKLYHAEASA